MTADNAARPAPPVAKKIPKTITQLGRTRTDDYAWMKDDNWQKVLRDPSLIKADVKEHLTQENAYTKAMLASTEARARRIAADNEHHSCRRSCVHVVMRSVCWRDARLDR